MSGSRYFLDTNAIIQLLSGNEELLVCLADAASVSTSIICELEFLSFPKLSEKDKALFREFCHKVRVVGLDHENKTLKKEIYKLRAKKGLKLPDAIIVASAICDHSTLVTADQKLLTLPHLKRKPYKPQSF